MSCSNPISLPSSKPAPHRRLFTVLVAAAALAVGEQVAQAAGPQAVAQDVSVEQSAEQTRIVVLLDRSVEIVERASPLRIVYHLTGARSGGRRQPVVAPDEEGSIARVELVPAGGDLDLVIDIRRSVVSHHYLVKGIEGFDLRVDLDEPPGSRPPPRRAAKAPAARPTGSAPQTTDAVDEAPRTLGGHTFLEPVRGPSPFVTTHLGLSFGFVHATFSGVDTHDGTAYPGELGALSTRLQLGARIVPRLGLIVAGEGRITSGFNGKSALNLGADGGGLWLLGLRGVVARIESTGTQIGAQISAEGSAGGRIAPITGFIDHVIASRAAPSAGDLFASASSHTGRFSWSAAQAIGTHASAQAWMGFAASWFSTGARPTEHAFDLTGGLALTLDGFPYVPLALLVEYDGDAILRGGNVRPTLPSMMLSDRGGSSFLTGLYYSGRRDLRLGVLGGVASLGAGPAHSSALARLDLGYFF